MNRHFIAFGDAGCNILQQVMTLTRCGQFSYVNQTAYSSMNDQATFISFLPPGEQVVFNKEQYVFSDFHKEAQLPPRLIENLSLSTHYMLISCLGGYTGTQLLKEFAKFLHNRKMQYSIFCGFPFPFEMAKRKRNAKWFLNTLPDRNAARVFYMDDLVKDLLDIQFEKTVQYTNRFMARELVWG